MMATVSKRSDLTLLCQMSSKQIHCTSKLHFFKCFYLELNVTIVVTTKKAYIAFVEEYLDKVKMATNDRKVMSSMYFVIVFIWNLSALTELIHRTVPYLFMSVWSVLILTCFQLYS